MAKSAKSKCTCCGKEKAPTRDFYLSHSDLYVNNEGRMTVCKDCFYERYHKYVNKHGGEVKALYHLCMNFDVYFNEKLVESAYGQSNRGNDKDSLIKSYITKVNSMLQYKGKSSIESDYIVLDSNAVNEIENKYIDEINRLKEDKESTQYDDTGIDITPNIRRRWGKGYSDEEYEDLEYFYKEYKNNLDHENDFMKLELIREMCTIKLIRDKAKRSGDYKTAREYSDLLSKKMADANLKPSQQKILGEADDDTFGMKLLAYERDKPVPEVLPEYKDVDKFWGYLVKNMIKPFANALGLASGEYSIEDGSDNVMVDDKVKDALKVNHNED